MCVVNYPLLLMTTPVRHTLVMISCPGGPALSLKSARKRRTLVITFGCVRYMSGAVVVRRRVYFVLNFKYRCVAMMEEAAPIRIPTNICISKSTQKCELK